MKIGAVADRHRPWLGMHASDAGDPAPAGECGHAHGAADLAVPNGSEPTDATDGASGLHGAACAGDADDGLVGVLGSLVQAMTGAIAFPAWSLPETQVGHAVGLAQQVRALAETLTAVLAGEADSRGLGTADGLSRADWLRAAAPGLDPAAAPTLARVAAAMHDPRWADLAAGVATGTVTTAQAGLILRLHDELATIADPDHLEGITTAMTQECQVLTVRELGRLAGHARASLKPPAELDAADAGMRLGRALTRLHATTAGFVEYRLRLDPEGAAILDAAIDPLARPRPDQHCHQNHPHLRGDHPRPSRTPHGTDHGTDEGTDGRVGDMAGARMLAHRDPRMPATRRADALLELIGRAVAAPHGVTRTPRTQLVVTMTHEALLGQLRGAGIADNDAVLSPGTVRRLACEASIIPAVLGGPSQILDLGRAERFFTPAQKRALARRDQGCSYPGCTIPPQWCEAHHLTHWADGGPTNLSNGALLCGRHHTVVHHRGLTATTTPTSITWHT